MFQYPEIGLNRNEMEAGVTCLLLPCLPKGHQGLPLAWG